MTLRKPHRVGCCPTTWALHQRRLPRLHSRCRQVSARKGENGASVPEEDNPDPLLRVGQLSQWDLTWVDHEVKEVTTGMESSQKSAGAWRRLGNTPSEPTRSSSSEPDSSEESPSEEEWGGEWADDGEEPVEGGTRPKGLPAEVRCFDRATIYVKSGGGGNGCVAFRREKFVPKGGPWGGNGGRGGHVWAVVDPSLNSLQSFRRGVHFRAKNGLPGSSNNQTGADGADTEVRVPPGTIIRERDADPRDPPVAELLREGDKALLVAGGRGGRGNSSFKSNLNSCPVIAESGEEGSESWLSLELKLVADAAIVGIPSAGKSTLLSVLSSAKPKIADYPFTTLIPNLGVCELDFETTVFADVPGLLEGAHLGRGLGLEFLRHTERCRAIVHVIDGSSPDPIGDYKAIRLEMRLFNPEIAEKPEVVAYNKMDLPDSSDYFEIVQDFLVEQGIRKEHIFPISSATGRGVTELVRGLRALLEDSGSEELEYTTDALNIQEVPKKDMSARMDDFEITEDHQYGRCYIVTGQGIERFAQMTNFDYFEGARRFQQVLKRAGVFKSLKKRGVREGDTVVIGKMETIWSDDQSDRALFKAWKAMREDSGKGELGSARWPRARLNL
eukprot:CAMPEP_0177582200 /NCGR_PEP_ID=MMETSP0419_2-20121207/2598_1 /TAXON_ID=582737 /ORGANISM="Tetraselmis sp., Strain GSL018" /LENGTH=613 /DNA_ID=CAMNT_0019071381 /DNA_START=221 /DNA_END=2062 /DNA_ORIENTATION=+